MSEGTPPGPPASPPPPPGSAPPPQPMSESEERTWALVAHLSGLVLSIVGPLLILLILGPRSAFLKNQSTEALNFQITVLVGIVVSLILTLVVVGIFLLIAVGITALVLQIIAALRAYEGVRYRYPINIRMVR